MKFGFYTLLHFLKYAQQKEKKKKKLKVKEEKEKEKTEQSILWPF